MTSHGAAAPVRWEGTRAERSSFSSKRPFRLIQLPASAPRHPTSASANRETHKTEEGALVGGDAGGRAAAPTAIRVMLGAHREFVMDRQRKAR